MSEVSFEEIVKAKWPDKHIYCAGQFDPDRPPHNITGYAIISALEPRVHLGYGKSQAEAWEDAARCIARDYR